MKEESIYVKVDITDNVKRITLHFYNKSVEFCRKKSHQPRRHRKAVYFAKITCNY